MLERRAFLKRSLAVLGAAALPLGCGASGQAVAPDGRLRARPRSPANPLNPGTHQLDDLNGRRSLLHLPTVSPSTAATPLILSLHGAGGSGAGALRALQASADANGFAILAPSSRAPTWDAIRGGFGPDVERIDAMLAESFQRWNVDPARVYVSGFSDGASYSLSLGLANGDLFQRVFAFSPGFVVGRTWRGKPPIFVSHGTRDEILPIDNCSRRIVPALKQSGYTVHYREFDGGHGIPPEVMAEAMRWMQEI